MHKKYRMCNELFLPTADIMTSCDYHSLTGQIEYFVYSSFAATQHSNIKMHWVVCAYTHFWQCFVYLC